MIIFYECCYPSPSNVVVNPLRCEEKKKPRAQCICKPAKPYASHQAEYSRYQPNWKEDLGEEEQTKRGVGSVVVQVNKPGMQNNCFNEIRQNHEEMKAAQKSAYGLSAPGRSSADPEAVLTRRDVNSSKSFPEMRTAEGQLYGSLSPRWLAREEVAPSRQNQTNSRFNQVNMSCPPQYKYPYGAVNNSCQPVSHQAAYGYQPASRRPNNILAHNVSASHFPTSQFSTPTANYPGHSFSSFKPFHA